MCFRPLLTVLATASFVASASAQDGGQGSALALIQQLIADGEVSDADKQSLRAAQAQATASSDKDLLGFFLEIPNLNDLWLVDQSRMTTFVRVSTVSSGLETRLTRFAASQFNASWKESNQSNGFKPIRDLLDEYKEHLRPMPDAERRQGRKIGYDAMALVDSHSNGAVPDFIYDWMSKGSEP